MNENRQIVFATANAHKLGEIREILSGSGWQIRTMREAGVDIDIEENGATFDENAMIKARAVAAALPQHERGAIVMADDSGLEIDALGGEPGVYSARYMGEDTPYTVKNQALIDRLDGVPGEARTARFVCAVAAVLPDGRSLASRGTIEGKIGYEARGENGFGYDPIFYLPDFSTTTAQLDPEEKNRISHRGKAIRAMAELLVDI